MSFDNNNGNLQTPVARYFVIFHNYCPDDLEFIALSRNHPNMRGGDKIMDTQPSCHYPSWFK